MASLRSILKFAVTAAMLLTPYSIKAAPLETVDEVRAAIFDKDFDAIAETAGTLQSLYRKGDVPAETLRQFFQQFTLSHPDVRRFAEEWLQREPDSVYAHAALGWSLHAEGWQIRGTNYVSQTYPDAMQKFYELHYKARAHAYQAYYADPYLIPASDLMIVLFRSTVDRETSLDVLQDVMKRQPNWGTLSRGLDFAHAGYGGNSQIAKRLCDHYGAMLSSPVEDMARYCHIQAMSRGLEDGGKPALRKLLEEEEHSSLDKLRATISIYHENGPSDRDAMIATQYFEQNESTDIQLAQGYDRRIAARFSMAPQSPKVIARAHEWARAELEHDPYNIDLLDILAHSIPVYSDPEDARSSYHTMPNMSDDEYFDHAYRRLITSPYTPEYWHRFGTALQGRRADRKVQGLHFLDIDDYAINAIVYSRHAPERLFNFIADKHFQLSTLKEVEERGLTGDWVPDPKQIDRMAGIICPILRADILYRYFNKQAGWPEQGELSPFMIEDHRRFAEQANEEGACQGILSAKPEKLLFEPIKMDLAAIFAQS